MKYAPEASIVYIYEGSVRNRDGKEDYDASVK